MEHKDIWIVLGLTVILAVAVSVSAVSLTGDAIFGKKVTVQKAPIILPSTPSCQIIGKGAQELPPNGPQITSIQLCETLSKAYKPIAIIQGDSFVYYADSKCKGDVIFMDLQTQINWRDTNAFLRVDSKENNGWTDDCEKSGITHDGKAVYVTRDSSSVKDVICCK